MSLLFHTKDKFLSMLLPAAPGYSVCVSEALAFHTTPDHLISRAAHPLPLLGTRSIRALAAGVATER